MTTQQSAIALRLIIVGELGVPSVSNPSDSLVAVNTSELPDGAQAFVLSTRSTYRLNKFSTQTAVGTAFVPAGNVGGGVWFFESGGDAVASNPFIYQATGTASLTGAQTPVLNTWIALPSGSGFYTSGIGNGVFSLNTSSGLITYDGPAGARYKASAIATLECGTAAQGMELAITQNGVLIGTTTYDGTAGGASADPTTAGLGECISTSKLITIASTGDTLQAVMRNITGTGTLNATHLNLLLTPA